VRPVLVEKCQKCHGPDKQKAALRLDTSADAMAGSEHGKIIVPGDPEKSRLIEVITSKDPDEKMPPKEPLKEN
jgi:hypothetical protein